MKTRLNHSWKNIALGITALSCLLTGVVSAGPAPVTVSLPIANFDTSVPIATVIDQPVTTSNIDPLLRYIGFQGDFTFDSTVVSFAVPVVAPAGLTAGTWTVSGNVLPGSGAIRTLRVSAFVNDGTTPLTGAGTLYNLRMLRVSSTPPASTPLTWRPVPDNFIFIDDNLDAFSATQIDGSITITGATPTPCPGCTPTPTPPPPTPTPTETPAPPTPTPGCPATFTQSTSQTITAGNSVSCNGGAPNFFHAESSYWRAFDMAAITGGSHYNVTSVSYGIESATANPSPGTQPVTVRLYIQTSGVFPGGTRTLIGSVTENLANQTGTVHNVPMFGPVVPAGTTQLIMEVFTPNGLAPVNNSFLIGSNAAGQGGPSYISAPNCQFNEPTDLATIGFGNMHIVFNVSGNCGPTPTPGTPTPPPTPTPTPSLTPTPPPTPTPTPTSGCPTTITQSSSQTITTGSASCNGGTPNFFHAENSYWRAFAMPPLTGGSHYNVTSVSYGIQTATANAAVGNQPVTVRLYTQTTGVFPGGTRTQIATLTENITNQTATVHKALITAFVPAGTTELIMEVFTPDGGAPINNSFFIGSNALPQTGTSYISAASCGLNEPTDVATIGFPNMHIVFNVNGNCGPTPTPGTPTPTPPITPTPSPTPTPVITPTPPPTPTPCEECTPTPTPTATPPKGGTPTVTPTPSSTPTTKAINLSTRMRVDTGDAVAIGGFIITGTEAKRVIIRGIGPSLSAAGITNPLADPVLELNGTGGFITVINNNWRDNQQQEIIDTGIPPTDDLEAAIVATLPPGAYTAIMRGNGGTAGVGLVEVYDLNQGVDSKLANLSTRAFVSTGNDIVIAGFLLSSDAGLDKIIVRGIGPSLADVGLSGVLANPMLELRDSNGTLLIANNDWQENPDQAALISASNLAPTNPQESALVAFLPSGLYTALLSGVDNTTGLGVVEIYDNPVGGPTPTPGPPTPTPGPTQTPGPTPTPGGPTPTPGPATPTPPPPTATPGGGPCTEAFDSVAAPALPAGWVASNPDPGDGVLFTTVMSPVDTAPNSAFIPDQDGISDKVLDSRPVTVNSAAAIMTFRNNFDAEFSDGVFWDGGVLEVSAPGIGGGEFLDITTPQIGGTITAGGYTGELSGDAENPLSGRMAWSANSNGYIDTVINLGPNLNGQTITLRFRFGTDQAVAAPGWNIDTISITGASCQ